MRTTDSKRSMLVVASILAGLSALGAAPAGAAICALDPTRTLFAGGPGTNACQQFTDEATCNMAFHQSGAGPLTPCRWTGSDCEGNTRNQLDDTVAHSCQTLSAPSCADASRTIKLTGGTVADDHSEVCHTLTDEATCEMAWHTGAKGVGIACCWNSETDDCLGSVWGATHDECTHGNTCFVSLVTAPAAAAPAVSRWALFALAVTLLGIGGIKVRALRHAP